MAIKMVTFPACGLAFLQQPNTFWFIFLIFCSEFKTGEIFLSECFENFSGLVACWVFLCVKINGIRRPNVGGFCVCVIFHCGGGYISGIEQRCFANARQTSVRARGAG